jgi:hypothetical protein
VRLQHKADGSYQIRADQADADRLLGQNNPITHVLRANFIWIVPHVPTSQSALRAASYVINDWQISGIWSGQRVGSNVTEGIRQCRAKHTPSASATRTAAAT